MKVQQGGQGWNRCDSEWHFVGLCSSAVIAFVRLDWRL